MIKTGILLYGFTPVNKNEGDIGPPPLTTNYLAAINKLTNGNSKTNDSVALGAILHASNALLTTDTLEKKDLEELHQKVSKLLQTMKTQNTKNSPLYSQLVEALWTSYPKMVFYDFT